MQVCDNLKPICFLVLENSPRKNAWNQKKRKQFLCSRSVTYKRYKVSHRLRNAFVVTFVAQKLKAFEACHATQPPTRSAKVSSRYSPDFFRNKEIGYFCANVLSLILPWQAISFSLTGKGHFKLPGFPGPFAGKATCYVTLGCKNSILCFARRLGAERA